MAPLGPFGPKPHLAVGVSGGPHSLALAMLARDWAAARGGRTTALVVDHGLRAESGAEATAAVDLLASLGIPGEMLPLALPPGAAVQERARAGRLAALLDRCSTLGTPWLLLGHHRGDQAETVLFRALRGSGAAGLAGMPACRAASQALVLRPLLTAPPGELEAHLKANGVVSFRDPSNIDPRFSRVRLRLVLADGDGDGPGVAALAEAADAYGRRRRRQDLAVARRLAVALRWRPEGWAWLDPAALGHDGIALAALRAAIRLVAGAEHPPPAAGAAALLAAGGGSLHGALWRRSLLCREPAACAPAVPATRGTKWDGRWSVRTAPTGCSIGPLGAYPSAGRRLPAWVVAGLPALWREGALLAVPALGIGPAAELAFRPAGGALGVILRGETRFGPTTWFQNAP
jgi:tRNA(Ile)-lysidine synthase